VITVDPPRKGLAPEVIASIAGMTALEVDGVCGLGSTLGTDLADILGKKNLSKGIRISIGEENDICVDCSIVVKLGQNIKEIGANVQSAVASNIESVTGFKVSAVNVTVAGIALPKDSKK